MKPDEARLCSAEAYRVALQAAVSRYEDLVRSLSVLREIDAIDDVAVPLGQLCRRLVEVIAKHYSAENCSLMLMAADGLHLELWAATGCLQDTAAFPPGEAPLGTRFRVGHGIAGHVVANGEPARIADVRNAEHFELLADSNVSLRSLLCLPLSAEGKVIGVINLSHSKPGYFSEQAEATMTMVAERCARLLASHQLLHRHRVVERCYQLACEKAGDGIVVFDSDGDIVLANSVAADLLGIDVREHATLSDSWFARIHEEDRAEVQSMRELLHSDGVPRTCQYRIIVPDGEARIIEEHTTLVSGSSDSKKQLVCVLRDVSKRVEQDREHLELEAQLRQAQKMEALGELAGGITHDFNNILTGILANVSLARSTLDTAQLPELLADIEAAATQGASLTRRLLAMSRRSQVERSPVEITGLIDDVLGILRNTLDRRVALHRNCEPGLWRARADRSQIHQVLLNLSVNARDALMGRLDEGTDAVITVSAANVVVDEEMCSRQVEAHPGEYVRIAVADTGKGIPESLHSRIFEPFFTTRQKEGGTGLGLAIAYGVVKQHRGWMTVKSEVGQGTEFTFYLPRSTSSDLPVPLRVPVTKASAGTLTVLVADDEDIMRRAAKRLLQKLGHHVILARDGVEAVKAFESAPTAIDVVLLDLNMPRMGGEEALRRIRSVRSNVAVIISTGHTRNVAATGIEGPPVVYLNKPYTIEMMAKILGKIGRDSPEE